MPYIQTGTDNNTITMRKLIEAVKSIVYNIMNISYNIFI